MPTEFIHTLRASGGDYTLMSTWATEMSSDLTSAASLVFAHGGITGTVSHGATVTGQTSLATGVVTGKVSSSQIYLTGILGGPFQSGEELRVTAGNSVTISDAGDSILPVLECYNDWPDGLDDIVTISFTSDAANFPRVTVPEGHRHNGVSTNGFWMKDGTDSVVLNSSATTSAVLEYLECYEYSSNTNFAVAITSGSASTIRDCIARTNPVATAGKRGFRSIKNNYTFINCIAMDCVVVGFELSSNTSYFIVNNCLAINCGIGYKLNVKDIDLFNCVAANCTTGFNAIIATRTITASRNASDDGTAPGDASVNVSANDFIDLPGNSPRPSSNSRLGGAGSSQAALFTTDIAGTLLTDKAWPIGPLFAYPIQDTPASIPDPKLFMPELLIPGRKPVGNVRIDWNNSLTRDIDTSAIYIPGLINDNKVTLTNYSLSGDAKGGLAAKKQTGNSKIDFGETLMDYRLRDSAFIMVFRQNPGSPNYAGFVGNRNAAGTTGWSFGHYWQSAKHKLALRTYVSAYTSVCVADTNFPQDGKWHAVAFSGFGNWNAGQIWADSVKLPMTGVDVNSQDSTTETLRFGELSPGADIADIDILAFIPFKRRFLDHEARSLTTNPYQFLIPA